MDPKHHCTVPAYISVVGSAMELMGDVLKVKTPGATAPGVFRNNCLTMSYFHERMFTIIGAEAFHGPVRDGKEWVHLAMVIKQSSSNNRY
jgi:hypothetical protein